MSNLRVASKIRSFLAGDSLPSLPPPPKKSPCNDPVLFQSLDKVITQKKWLPTIRSSKAIHPNGFSSDHFLTVAVIKVKLGARVPTPTRPPKREVPLTQNNSANSFPPSKQRGKPPRIGYSTRGQFGHFYRRLGHTMQMCRRRTSLSGGLRPSQKFYRFCNVFRSHSGKQQYRGASSLDGVSLIPVIPASLHPPPRNHLFL